MRNTSTQELMIFFFFLMYNFNNNAAELYNSILAKFIGRKRVNFSQKGMKNVFNLNSIIIHKKKKLRVELVSSDVY